MASMATMEATVLRLAREGSAAPDETWVVEAACASADPRDFFPQRGDAAAGERARAVCQRCPRYDECLLDALAGTDVGGIRAETTETQRRHLRRLWAGARLRAHDAA